MAGAFLWDDKVAKAASLTAVTGTPVASMPLSNLLDPQPRLRARLLGNAAGILIDFGADTAIEAVALMSTTLPSDATIRWRAGPTTAVSAFDTGTLAASTSDAANGNIVLLNSSAVTARYLQIDLTSGSATVIDIGRLVAGPLWRISRAMAYGVTEGRLMLDRRDRNPLTGAEFPVPALVNPRITRFTLPLLTNTEIRTQHRTMVAALGVAGDTLWIPDTGLTLSELNTRCLWGAAAASGDEVVAVRDHPTTNNRSFRIVERL